MTRQIILVLCSVIVIISLIGCGQEKKANFDSIRNRLEGTWIFSHDSLGQTIDSIILFRSGTVMSTGQPIYTLTTKAEKRITDSLTQIKELPNPFAPATTFLPYDVSEKSGLRIAIYDTLGNKAADLIHRKLPPGEYLVNFSIYSVLEPGTYFLETSSADAIRTWKLVIR